MVNATTLNTEKYRLINLLASYGIKDPLLSLFDNVPRELFINRKFVAFAYEDRALPTRFGQTISQPSLIAIVLQALDPKLSDTVLEIGTGSGFQTALLGKLVKKVYTIERFPELAREAQNRLASLRIKNAEVITGDGSVGWKKGAPYDAVVVTAAFYQVPQPLIDQLKDGGRLIMPIGREEWQQLILYKKNAGKLEVIKRVSDVRFVPFVGKHAWAKN